MSKKFKTGIIADANITAPEVHATTKLVANTVGGDEGGEILLGIAQTNTTLSGTGVTIDVYQNKLRFFEQGGSARGYYIDISTGGAGVGTNLVGGGGGGFTNPMTTLGDIIYGSTSGTAARLAGNTSTTTYILSSTGTGTASASPTWISTSIGSSGYVALDTNTTFSGTITLPTSTSIGNVSSTEIGYLDGVTSNIQTQFSGKSDTTHTHTFASLTSKPTTLSGFGITDAQGLNTNLTGISGLATSPTSGIVKNAAGTWSYLTDTTVGDNLLTLTNPSAITFIKINADNTVTAESAATHRTSIGATTVGSNLFTLTNPSAITFLKVNADNSVSTESAATFKTSLSLNNVENTALSTWAGSTNLTTIGAATASSLTVTGNLTVNGTTQTVNSTVVTFDDPIITLGGDTATAETSKDRGMEFKYAGATVTMTNYIGNGTTTVTGTTTSTTGWAAGDIITISGASGQLSGINGTWTIASVPSGTTFTFVVSGTINSNTYTNNLGTIVRSKNGFLGYLQSANTFTMLSQGNNASEVFSGSTGNLRINAIEYSTTAATGTAITQVFSTTTSPLNDTAITSTYAAAEYIVFAKTSTGRYTSKVMLIWDGSTTPTITEYAILSTGTIITTVTAIGTTSPQLNVAVSGGTVQTIRLVRTLVAA